MLWQERKDLNRLTAEVLVREIWLKAGVRVSIVSVENRRDPLTGKHAKHASYDVRLGQRNRLVQTHLDVGELNLYLRGMRDAIREVSGVHNSVEIQPPLTIKGGLDNA